MSRAVSLYLSAYNISQSIGWSIALTRIISCCLSTKSVYGAYAVAGDLICILQTVSFLEVVHAVISLVPSGVLLSLMQWGGRTHFLLAIVRQIEEVQDLPSVFITFVAWSISEVIRYSHFALMGLGFKPRWLVYLRYTAFIVLYPAGVGPGEMWLIYQSLPFIKDKALYSASFSSLPFTYHTFVTAVLVCYPFLWLRLYLHLFKQRKAKLGTNRRPKKD